MEYCVNCKHFQRYAKGLSGYKIDVKACNKQPLEHDLVTGEPLYRFATVERTIINDPNHCGKDGKWFEFMQTEDLDDLSAIPFGR